MSVLHPDIQRVHDRILAAKRAALEERKKKIADARTLTDADRTDIYNMIEEIVTRHIEFIFRGRR